MHEESNIQDGKSAIHVQVNSTEKLWQPGSCVRKLRNLGSRDFVYQALPLLKVCSGAKVICARTRGEPGDEATIWY